MTLRDADWHLSAKCGDVSVTMDSGSTVRTFRRNWTTLKMRGSDRYAPRAVTGCPAPIASGGNRLKALPHRTKRRGGTAGQAGAVVAATQQREPRQLTDPPHA